MNAVDCLTRTYDVSPEYAARLITKHDYLKGNPDWVADQIAEVEGLEETFDEDSYIDD